MGFHNTEVFLRVFLVYIYVKNATLFLKVFLKNVFQNSRLVPRFLPTQAPTKTNIIKQRKQWECRRRTIQPSLRNPNPKFGDSPGIPQTQIRKLIIQQMEKK